METLEKEVFRKALVIALLNAADHPLTMDEIGFEISNTFLQTYVKQLVIDKVLTVEHFQVGCSECSQTKHEARYSISIKE